MTLDEALIAERIAESAQVSALLATIFSDDDPQPLPGPRQPAGPASTATRFGPGLSDDHLTLLRELAASPTWSRSDFDALAEKHGLLAAGALDVLNETALELADDLVLEGDEELTVNTKAIVEMLK